MRSAIPGSKAVLLSAARRLLRPAGLLAAAILYGGAPALASDVIIAPAPPPLAPPVPLPPHSAGPLTLPSAPARGSAPERAEKAEPSAALDGIPHIALLLPLDSGAFGRHAEAVRHGFLAAAKVQGHVVLPLRIYSTGEDPQHVAEAYLGAVSAGARLVVGPLTRSGVAAVAGGPVPVPTLALNVPEGGVRVPNNLHVLSLHAEAEARQVARLAYREGNRRALTVNGGGPLMQRIHRAFVDEFARLGGSHVAEYAYTTDPDGLARIKKAAGLGVADMAFLALDLPQARLARPYLDPLALYATSHVFPGSAGPLLVFDLAGVRFLDMPWLLQPDHPAVMVYPRGGYRDAVELERFYALGIDAFRVAQELAAGRPEVSLDGVTGRITPGPEQQFARTLTAAQFLKGRLVVTTVEPRP